MNFWSSNHFTARIGAFIATALLLLVAAGLGQTPAENSESREFTISVSVNDNKGVHIDDIEKERFVVIANGKEQTVLESSLTDVPYSVGFLIDTSGSMKGHGKLAVTGFAKFLANSNGANEYFVVSFAENPDIVLDYSTNPENVLSAINNAYEDGVKGNTDLFKALSAAFNKLESSSYKDRVLIVFGDAVITEGSVKMDDLTNWLKMNHARLYFVSAVSLKDRYTVEFAMTAAKMDEMSKINGGQAFYNGDPEGVLDSFLRAALEIKNLHRLRFSLDKETFDRTREKGTGIDLKVKVIRMNKNGKKSPKLKAVTRKKLYLPEAQAESETK